MRGGWVEQRPEPARLWVRWRPRGWPRPAWPWIDVADGELGEAAEEPGEAGAAAALRPPPAAVDDAVWLPPVPPAAWIGRRELAARLAAAGVPVIVQVPVPASPAAGEREEQVGPAGGLAAPSPVTVGLPQAGTTVEREDLGALAALARSGVVLLLDPVPALLANGVDGAVAATGDLAEALPGAAVVWPLIPGFSTGEETAGAAARAFAAAGVAALQPMALRLSAAQRRRLAEERGAEVFDALFHRPPPDERRFARAAAAAGLAPWLPRPLPRPPLAGAETRRLAGLLALAAELWLRCGRPPAAGQALFRAARWADDAGYDLGALAREGNLGVVAALDARSRALIAEGAAGGTPSLVRELLAEYTAPEDAGAAAAGEPRVAMPTEEVGNG